MRKICIINQKGGVAKTTTTISIGAGLARKGKKTLIIDLDPQGNIATSITESNEKGIYDFLINDLNLEYCISHMGTNMDILTSKENLHKAEAIILKKENPSHFLKDKLSEITGYDYILIDCPPSLGLLNQSVLLYSQEAIIPVSTDYLGYDALKKIIVAIEDINNYYEHNIKISKIIPTIYDKRNKMSKNILDKLNSEYFEIITHPIRICSKTREAPMHKKSIFSYAPKSRGAKDYLELVNLILQDEFLNKPELFETKVKEEITV